MKKRYYIVILCLVVMVITGCSSNTDSNISNNVKSVKESKIVDKKGSLDKYPSVKEKIIELESKLNDKNIQIDKINFEETNNQLIITYYFNNSKDKLFNYYNLNKDTNEFEFSNYHTMIYDDNTFNSVKDIIINSLDFTDEELNEIKKINKNGDYVRVRGYKYLIDYEEQKDSIGLRKQFRIMVQG